MPSRSALRLWPATILLATAAPTLAQGTVEGRVGRLESEMRAVQRKVFPGGAGTLQPDIVAPTATIEGPGSPASSAIVDVTQRVTSLEQQMATLTGQIEQNGYQLRTLREQFEAYKRSTDARIAAASAAPAGADTSATTPVAGALSEDDVPAARPSRAPATRPAPADRPATTVSGTGGASTAAPIARPSTGDPAEDSYLAGYRLWEAKRYPEAQAALKKTVADYPKSRRASYAQNLLGRAYLDDGKPSLASMAFYDNYKKMPDGERAPDSLLYLGQALERLNKPADACKVYAELTDVYAGKLSTQMQADVAKGRATSKCK